MAPVKNKTRLKYQAPALLIALLVLYSCQPRNNKQAENYDVYETTYFNSGVDIPITDQDIVFIRDYTYYASEDDSKTSSRKKALERIRTQLSEEIGVYMESYLEINKIVSADITREDVSHEIRTLSSSITSIDVLDESWDGKTYYVKAGVKTNPQQAVTSLLEAIKAKSAKTEIDRLNMVIAEQKQKLLQSEEKAAELQKELVRQELLYETRQSGRINAKNELIRTNEERIIQEQLLAEDIRQVQRIKKIVKESKQKRERIARKACLIEKGMTRAEVEDAMGQPDHGGRNDSVYHYGDIRILFSYPTSRVYAVRGCRYL